MESPNSEAEVGRQEHQVRAKQALASFLVFCAILGSVGAYLDSDHIREPWWWRLTSTALATFILFAWYYYDSECRGYPRSTWLNIGVVGFALVAIPYYLIRSRPPGQKGKALLKCLGFCVLSSIATGIGELLGSFFG